ncbi:MAG: GatB/YqeY domain-containing protein [Gammaproteobacteria bacterium]|nr:GatB/YqeY domain-containing protein [Gammaproteobacteria bacterium]MCF6231188.1 GatB/YqeY domain-containing protein [Gammaproteobacteria bacterium]
MTLKQQLIASMKDAMRARQTVRLGVIRLVNAAIKQKEVDERIELNDEQVLEVLTKMVKQRKESISQFESANRQDLADIEHAEVAVIKEFLPEAMSEAQVSAEIDEVMAETGASSLKDMGKVMAALKPKLQGRADMGQVSAHVKKRLLA